MKIEFTTGNAAFHDPIIGDNEAMANELENIFGRIIEDVRFGNKSGVIMDTNGNKVGKWES